MRNRLMIGTAALLLASATFAGAQDKPQPETHDPVERPDRHRRPLHDAPTVTRRATSATATCATASNANFLYNKETSDWTFDVMAKNIGYRDGRYELLFNSSRMKFTALFDQSPLNYAYYAQTPYNCTAGNCALDAGPAHAGAERAQADRRARRTSASSPPGRPTTRSPTPFDMQSRRDTIAADLRFSATDNLDFIFGVNSYKRTGNMPYGAGFAFNVASELPIVIDNRETELNAARSSGRATRACSTSATSTPSSTRTSRRSRSTTRSARPTTAGPGSPARRRAPATTRAATRTATGRPSAAWRSRRRTPLDTVNWMGMVKLPAQTTANASFSMGANHQDAALIPWTTNSSITTAGDVRGVSRAGRAAPRARRRCGSTTRPAT